MSTNRIRAFLRPIECDCCREREHASRQRDRVMAEAERIELLADDAIEVMIPSLQNFMGEREPGDDDDDGENIWALRFFVRLRPRVASFDESLTQYAADELRRIAAELLAAADRVEGGVSA